MAKSQMSWQAWKKVSTKRLQDVGTCRNCRDQDGAPKRNASQQPQCASGSERGWLYFAGTEGSAEAICDTRKPKTQRGQAGGSEARRAGASGGRGSVVAEASGDLLKCRVGGTASRGESRLWSRACLLWMELSRIFESRGQSQEGGSVHRRRRQAQNHDHRGRDSYRQLPRQRRDGQHPPCTRKDGERASAPAHRDDPANTAGLYGCRVDGELDSPVRASVLRG